MVDIKIQNMKQNLRAQLERFINIDLKQYYPQIYRVFELLDANKYPAFLCGGVVRNMLLGNNRIPRDIDIIVGNISRCELEDLFRNYFKVETSLGGLKLQVKEWSIDMWPIEETWAFREGKIDGKEFSDYPKTTFLNIEAIAIQIFNKSEDKKTIYSNGFFKAIAERTLEINFEDNPAPAECIIRALRIAIDHKFIIGPKLAHFMISSINKMDMENLSRIYKHRYMSQQITADNLRKYFESIKKQVHSSSNRPVNIFAD
jgi:hypothetical protein